MRRLLSWIVAIVLVAGCARTPTRDDLASASESLTEVLPILTELGVTTFRDQDWCHNIDYHAGFFSSKLTDQTACNLSTADPRPFDDAADADWQRVHDALAATGLAVSIVNVDLDDERQVVVATFQRHAPFTGSTFYLYDPQGNWSHESEPNELEFTPIDGAWWFVWEDWN